MRVNNNINDENLVHSDLVHRYSRTAQAIRSRKYSGFVSDLEAAIDRDTVKTPDPLFAGAAQKYEQENITTRKDTAISAPALTKYTYTGRDTLLVSASQRYLQMTAQTSEKPDPLIASLLAKYERAGTMSEHRDPAINSPA